MMKFYFILLVATLFIPILSFAQTDTTKSPNQRNAPTKGYYAIGDNGNKLRINSKPSNDSVIIPTITKGYYALKNNNQKLAKKPSKLNQQQIRPTVTKGYYLIGNNAEKLNKNK